MSAHGRVIWNELNTHDPEKAKSFFGETLGWSFDDMPMDGGAGTYTILKIGEDRIGGMFVLKGAQFDGVPEHWMTYFGVDNVDQRVAQAVKSGASVLRDAWDIPDIGRVAILRAPGGAVMAWMTPNTPAV